MEAGRCEVWFFKLKHKKEQDSQRLIEEIKEAGANLLSVQRVRVRPESIRRKKMGPVAACPQCGEAYPVRDGERCRACGGESPYL
jgi:formylmethanofuran dehydrogenase subunit E